MSKHAVRLLLSAVLVLLSAGCLRSAQGSEFEDPLSRPLPTDTPTYTPIPTQEPAATVVITEVSTVVVEVEVEREITSTPDPVIQQTLDAAQAVAQVVNTAIPEPTFTTEPAVDAGSIPNQFPTESDERFRQATEIIGTATQQVLNQTLEAAGPTVELPTLTPTLNPSAIATNTEQPAVGGPIVPGQDCVHQIVAGENLFRLSMRYGVSIQDLAIASGITNSSLVLVGQRVTIPGCGTTGQVPPPTTAPTANPNVGTGGAVDTTANTAQSAPSAARTHIVRQYETLFELSLTYGSSVEAIASANGIASPYVIFIGQELVIP